MMDPMPFFVVERVTDDTGRRWAYIDRCPHGMDIGGIYIGPNTTSGTKWSELTWQWADLGTGECKISPSILLKGLHEGKDCHFGPGKFEFMYLEEGECRNTEPFATRYESRTGRTVARFVDNEDFSQG